MPRKQWNCRRVKIVGRYPQGSHIQGVDVKVYDYDTGKMIAEAQSLDLLLDINMECLMGRLDWIDFSINDGHQNPINEFGDVVITRTSDVEVMEIDIRQGSWDN
jgi:hypothetical protein